MDISRPCSALELNPFNCPDQASIPVSQDTIIEEQSSASLHDYASDGLAIGAGVDGVGHLAAQRYLDVIRTSTLS